MATFKEIAARSVSNLFSLYFVYLYYLFISRFGFKSGICLLIAPVPVLCFSITFPLKPRRRFFKTLYIASLGWGTNNCALFQSNEKSGCNFCCPFGDFSMLYRNVHSVALEFCPNR